MSRSFRPNANEEKKEEGISDEGAARFLDSLLGGKFNVAIDVFPGLHIGPLQQQTKYSELKEAFSQFLGIDVTYWRPIGESEKSNPVDYSQLKICFETLFSDMPATERRVKQSILEAWLRAATLFEDIRVAQTFFAAAAVDPRLTPIQRVRAYELLAESIFKLEVLNFATRCQRVFQYYKYIYEILKREDPHALAGRAGLIRKIQFLYKILEEDAISQATGKEIISWLYFKIINEQDEVVKRIWLVENVDVTLSSLKEQHSTIAHHLMTGEKYSVTIKNLATMNFINGDCMLFFVNGIANAKVGLHLLECSIDYCHKQVNELKHFATLLEAVILATSNPLFAEAEKDLLNICQKMSFRSKSLFEVIDESIAADIKNFKSKYNNLLTHAVPAAMDDKDDLVSAPLRLELNWIRKRILTHRKLVEIWGELHRNPNNNEKLLWLAQLYSGYFPEYSVCCNYENVKILLQYIVETTPDDNPQHVNALVVLYDIHLGKRADTEAMLGKQFGMCDQNRAFLIALQIAKIQRNTGVVSKHPAEFHSLLGNTAALLQFCITEPEEKADLRAVRQELLEIENTFPLLNHNLNEILPLFDKEETTVAIIKNGVRTIAKILFPVLASFHEDKGVIISHLAMLLYPQPGESLPELSENCLNDLAKLVEFHRKAEQLWQDSSSSFEACARQYRFLCSRSNVLNAQQKRDINSMLEPPISAAVVAKSMAAAVFSGASASAVSAVVSAPTSANKLEPF